MDVHQPTYLHMCINNCMHTTTSTITYCLPIFVHTHLHLHIPVYMCVCRCLYVSCMYVWCMCVCIFYMCPYIPTYVSSKPCLNTYKYLPTDIKMYVSDHIFLSMPTLDLYVCLPEYLYPHFTLIYVYAIYIYALCVSYLHVYPNTYACLHLEYIL